MSRLVMPRGFDQGKVYQSLRLFHSSWGPIHKQSEHQIRVSRPSGAKLGLGFIVYTRILPECLGNIERNRATRAQITTTIHQALYKYDDHAVLVCINYRISHVTKSSCYLQKPCVHVVITACSVFLDNSCFAKECTITSSKPRQKDIRDQIISSRRKVKSIRHHELAFADRYPHCGSWPCWR